MSSIHSSAIPVLHFNIFLAPAAPGSDPGKYSASEKRAVARKTEFWQTGSGYSAIQGTKVSGNTASV